MFFILLFIRPLFEIPIAILVYHFDGKETLQCALNGFKWMLLKSIMKVMERVRSDISPE